MADVDVDPDADLIQSAAEFARVVARVIDNEGETADRYAVYFVEGDVLSMSGAPIHPQGFSQWGSYEPDVVDQNVERGPDRDIGLYDLPPDLLAHAIVRYNDGMRETLLYGLDEGDTRERILERMATQFDLVGDFRRDVLYGVHAPEITRTRDDEPQP
jgi:hypothetical protein